jgi:hypothetical protein
MIKKMRPFDSVWVEFYARPVTLVENHLRLPVGQTGILENGERFDVPLLIWAEVVCWLPYLS